MRNTCDSSNTLSTRAFSSRASSSDEPNGFSMITRTSVSARRDRPLPPSWPMITGKKLGRGGEVEGAVQPHAGLLVEPVQHLAQRGVDARIVEHARHVPDVFEQPREHVLVGRAPRERADRLLALGAVVLVRFFSARDPDQLKALGQGALVGEVVQRRQQFAPRQIARRAEDHERRRRHRLALQARARGGSPARWRSRRSPSRACPSPIRCVRSAPFGHDRSRSRAGEEGPLRQERARPPHAPSRRAVRYGPRAHDARTQPTSAPTATSPWSWCASPRPPRSPPRRWWARGDKEAADQAAVDGMRYMLHSVPMDGVVVIGEGEKDEAPMLYNGEQIGDGSPPQVDIAVDPLEGTTLAAHGMPSALAVIALSARGTMFDPGPCVYMEKMAGSPEIADLLDLDRPLAETVRADRRAQGHRRRRRDGRRARPPPPRGGHRARSARPARACA